MLSWALVARQTFVSQSANLELSEWVPVPHYPNHPPLDYQELIGLEAMGQTELPIGKLRKKFNIRQLLDGYETIESRKIKGDYIANQTNYYQYGQGDNMGGDKVDNDKIGRDKF